MVSNGLEKQVKITNGIITLIDWNIFCVDYNKGAHLDLEDFKQVRAIYDEFSADEELKILVCFPEFVTVSPEARDFAEKNPILALKEAIVFTSLAQRLLVRFYMIWHRQKHPVKTFTSKAKAIVWLNANES